MKYMLFMMNTNVNFLIKCLPQGKMELGNLDLLTLGNWRKIK